MPGHQGAVRTVDASEDLAMEKVRNSQNRSAALASRPGCGLGRESAEAGLGSRQSTKAREGHPKPGEGPGSDHCREEIDFRGLATRLREHGIDCGQETLGVSAFKSTRFEDSFALPQGDASQWRRCVHGQNERSTWT
jgi:hypothetical protein